MKKVVSFALLLTLVFCLFMTGPASAGTSIENCDTGMYYEDQNLYDELLKVPEFKFWHHENGIGYGACPVYSAPYANAYRTANGRATISTDHEMYDGGFVAGWLMVRYETNNGGVNVGYIPPQYITGFKSNWGTREFAYVPVVAAQAIKVTNNPLLPGSGFAILDPGESFHVLAKYNYHYDWWYIECMVDGKVARGFIDRGTSSFWLDDALYDAQYSSFGNTIINAGNLGIPSVSPWNTYYCGDVRVDGGIYNTRRIARKSPDSNSDEIAYLESGGIYPCYSIRMGIDGKEWYGIWIERISKWGWISSEVSTFSN